MAGMEGRAPGYEIIHEGNEEVMKINYEASTRTPSLEDDPLCMMDVIDKLAEKPSVSRIIFSQRRFYSYDYNQTQMLVEIANIYSDIVKRKKALTIGAMGLSTEPTPEVQRRYAFLQYLIINLLRSDPIGAYVELKREIRQEHIKQKEAKDTTELQDRQIYIDLLTRLHDQLDQTKLITQAKPYIPGYTAEDRSIYKSLFRATLTPDFMFTQLMASPPLDGEQLDIYTIGKSEVTLFNTKKDIKPLYHLNPPEFKISEDKYALVDLAKTVLVEHKPREEEFLDPSKMRVTFLNISRDLLRELAETRGIDLAPEEVEELAEITVRHTIGFGIMEIILEDQKVQDITINSPMGQTPIFVLHQDYDECVSNIIPSISDAESWAAKFRLLSGRPLDEANPVLDTELVLPLARSRVAVITKPLTPHGLAYCFRRHRDKPWTLALFTKNRMMSPLAAGLMSFLIDGARTLLVAGTRSSGKCVSGDTLIQLNDGRIIPISHLAKTEEGIEEKSYGLNANVLSLDDYKIKNSATAALYKRKAPKEIIKIKTQSGKEIITTPEHPYFTFDFGIKEVFADNIMEGMFIAAPRIIKTKPKEVCFSFDAPQAGKGYLFKGKTNSPKFHFPKQIDKEMAEFLGYVSGDGHIASTHISFFNSNNQIRKKYKQLTNKLFGIKFREFKTRTTTCVQISSRNLVRIVSSTFCIPVGKKSATLRIPQQILQSNNKILSAYIKALFDCDSHMGLAQIEFASASGTLIDQLQMALLRFGIISSKKPKKVKNRLYYGLFIYGDSIKKYKEHIGFNHPSKNKRLMGFSSQHHNTNTDIIPGGTKIFRELRHRLHITPKRLREAVGKDYWAYENDAYRTSRHWFKIIIRYFKERQAEIAKLNIGPLYNLMRNNQQEISRHIKELRKIIPTSYVELGLFLGTTESNVRKILKNKSKSHRLKTIANLAATYGLFEDKIGKQHFNYAEMSRITNIPETSLKSYFYGGINPPTERKILIEHFLENHNLKLQENNKKALEIISLLKEKHQQSSINYAQIGLLLNTLRTELSIPNETIASKEISLSTVTNFFNGYFNDVNVKVIKAITKNILSIYEEATSEKTRELLMIADKAANSDIFWDKVVKVERIESKEDYVYDLSIPDSHNFIANGLIAHNTSLLGACLVEIMRKYRIITVEDTLELPADALRELGYNIQQLKVRSALSKGGSEPSAEEGIRTALRLGDSSLIVGEVRSTEALALYEAMRVGALANVVAGTIHGDSPYGVFDRVVNDLGVPRTSFKATDIIVVANPLKSPDGLHKWRRMTQITEVRKSWEDDPLREGGFVDLMKYNTKTDQLEPSDDLINGNSEVLKAIGGNVKEWAGDWDAIWDNVVLRANLKKLLIDYALRLKNDNLLEAPFVIRANDQFHRISAAISDEVGFLDSKRIAFEWEEWLKRVLRKEKI